MDIKWPVSHVDFHRIGDGVVVEIINSDDVEKLFYNYAKGFYFASNRLTRYILEKPDIRKLDIYFFTVAYLYRHSIELILKAIGSQYITESKERKEFIKRTHHNLHKLLIEINPYITILIEKDENAYNWLSDYLLDISKVDAKSDF